MAGKKGDRFGQSGLSALRTLRIAVLPVGGEKEVQNMKPLLSIAMIVKNEERCIERSLKALQPLRDQIPCEIVVADTGSEDRTKEIVQKYADICFDFEWVNDFAAARNATIARCTGEWLLVLDADEYLEPEHGELLDFLTCKERDQYDLAYINIVSYSNFEMQGDATEFMALRMAKMSNHPRYDGAIHESLRKSPMDKVKYLREARFKHDGYAADGGHGEKKLERNTELLEQELQKKPKDLRLLYLLARDAKHKPMLQLECARRAMDVLSGDPTSSDAKRFGSGFCSEAINIAVQQRIPELEQWIEQSFKWFPSSIVLGVNANYLLAIDYCKKQKYERVPEFANAFFRAWNRYHENDFDPEELTGGLVNCGGRKYEVTVRAFACQALAQLGRKDEAAEILFGETGWDEADQQVIRELIKSALWAADDEKMQRVMAETVRTLREMPGAKSAELWSSVCEAADIIFQAHELDKTAPENSWQLFRYTNGVLGQAVQLMETGGETLRSRLDEVEDWKYMPMPVITRVVRQGAVLPPRFYKQGKERMEKIAGVLCKAMEADDLLEWIEQNDFSGSMAYRQFRFMLQSGLMQNAEIWKKNEEEAFSAEKRKQKTKLCRQFADAAADFLPGIYSDALMENEEEWNVMPATHTFALYLLRGRDAKQKGDEVGYVRALQSALAAVESTKNIVEYLLEHPAWKQPVSPELAALAEQVRSILAQYPSDDPAVQQLKSSPVYQQVAHLIEE